MELNYRDTQDQPHTVVAQLSDTVDMLADRIRDQLGYNTREVEVVFTWGTDRLASHGTIESFLDFVENDEMHADKKMTIHILFYDSPASCPDGTQIRSQPNVLID